jgi:hypothetical protein
VSEQYLSANPEFLFHYERLRRDRALLRRQGYVLLIAAGALLAGVILIGSAGHQGRPASFLPLALFLGFAVLLTCNGVLAIHRSRKPINDDEVARRRQDERRQLFQFAQGHISWRYWLAVAIQCLIGAIFLALGLQGALSLLAHPNTVDFLDTLLSGTCLLVGWYSLASAFRRALRLRRLARVSSQELAARLSLGEATEGE